MIHAGENYSIESDENGRYWLSSIGALTREPLSAKTHQGWIQSDVNEMRAKLLAEGMNPESLDEYCRQAGLEW